MNTISTVDFLTCNNLIESANNFIESSENYIAAAAADDNFSDSTLNTIESFGDSLDNLSRVIEQSIESYNSIHNSYQIDNNDSVANQALDEVVSNILDAHSNAVDALIEMQNSTR